MSLNKNNIFIFFSFLIFGNVLAQDATQKKDTTKVEKLEEVVVTATRTVRQLSSLPMPVQLVSKADIKKSNSVRLSDILAEQTGLITVPDFGGGEGIQLQGLDSQYTLVLIDGVPLIGRSAGTLDLNRVTVGNIKQIEIVKGPSSSLYGSEALGGVVNIITETPKFGTRGSLNYRAASFGNQDASASISHKKNKLGLSFFVNRNSSDGYDLLDSPDFNTVNPFVNYTFNAKATYEISDKTNLIVSGRYYTQQIDAFVAGRSGENNTNEWNVRTNLRHQHSDRWESTIELYGSRYKVDEFLNNTDGTLFSEAFFNQFFFRPEYRSTINFNQNTLTFGLGTTHESLDRTYFDEKPEFNAPYVFAQYDMNPTEKLNIIIGARYDSHNQYQSQFNPKVAANYQLNEKISFKTSVGRGFKAPDFRQLYFDFANSAASYIVLGYNVVPETIPELLASGQISTVVVPISEFEDALNAESSWGYNIGTDIKWNDQLKFNINAFRNDVQNLIDTRIIATGNNNVFSYVNIAEVYTQGLEFDALWRPKEGLRIAFGYQLMYAKDKEAVQEFKDGNVFARLSASSPSFQLSESDYFGLYNRSRHTANVKIFYNIPQWNADANIRTTYRSKFGQFDSNANNYLDKYDVFVDGYAVVDTAINKNLWSNYQVGFGVDNVFGFTNPQNISNIPGRILYGKLNIQL